MTISIESQFLNVTVEVLNIFRVERLRAKPNPTESQRTINFMFCIIFYTLKGKG